MDEFVVRSEWEMDSRGQLTVRREVSVIKTRKDAMLPQALTEHCLLTHDSIPSKPQAPLNII